MNFFELKCVFFYDLKRTLKIILVIDVEQIGEQLIDCPLR